MKITEDMTMQQLAELKTKLDIVLLSFAITSIKRSTGDRIACVVFSSSPSVFYGEGTTETNALIDALANAYQGRAQQHDVVLLQQVVAASRRCIL